jgi:hypothetical protein
MFEAVTAWALAIMVAWAPPGRSKIRGAVETEAEGQARYAEIARTVVNVVYEPTTQPLFRGAYGRASTAALLLAVAFHESGFRRDVDLGIGKLARGSGTDSCLMQIRVGSGRTPQGWSHTDLVQDRQKCFLAGLALIRRSFAACHRLSVRDWLSAYTRGRCVENDPSSRSRVDLATRTPRSPISDAEAMRSVPDASAKL